MARQLWLLRHGEAEPHEAKPDAERALTARGQRQSGTAGAALARLGLEFAACYASPKVRGIDTARLACESLGVEPEIHDPLHSGFDADGARELFDAHDSSARLLIVGHEPDFTQIVRDLTGARIDLKKGGVAAVRLDGSRSELIVLLRPRELETLVL
jgi:phosphohistidine phosphatase